MHRAAQSIVFQSPQGYLLPTVFQVLRPIDHN